MRPSRDEILMSVARTYEKRSTCARNHVGAVISIDGRILTTGYNGTPAGMPHCDHSALLSVYEAVENAKRIMSPIPRLDEGESAGKGCREAVHAEANALAFAARVGVAVLGATIHTTLSPCYDCAKLIIAAGLTRVVFDRTYRDASGLDLLARGAVEVVALTGTGS